VCTINIHTQNMIVCVDGKGMSANDDDDDDDEVL
jgi:hypothetical protein